MRGWMVAAMIGAVVGIIAGLVVALVAAGQVERAFEETINR